MFSITITGECKSKEHWHITSHLSEWLFSNRQQAIIVGEDVEEREPSFSVGTVLATMENSMVSTQKIKNTTIYDPAIPLLGIYPKKTIPLVKKYICNPMFIE